MEIVCTPADIVPRPVLTVVDPIGFLLEYHGKENPNKQMRGKNDYARTPKSIFCKTVCRKTLGETNANSKLPYLPDLDSRALIIVIIQLLHCHFRSQLHQFCIFVLFDCLALD